MSIVLKDSLSLSSYKDIREDVSMDMDLLRQAEDIYERIRKYIFNNSYGENSEENSTYYAKKIMLHDPQDNPFVASAVVLNLNKVLEDVSSAVLPLVYVVFLSDQTPLKFHAAIGTYQNQKAIILPIASGQEHLRSIPSGFWQNKKIFIHEITHYLDMIRSYPVQGKNSAEYADKKDWKGYYNNPQEFNAYWNEGLHFIHNATLTLSHGKQEIWFKWYPNFETFLTNKEKAFDPDYLHNLTPLHKRRLINRLYQYYTWVSERWAKYKNQ